MNVDDEPTHQIPTEEDIVILSPKEHGQNITQTNVNVSDTEMKDVEIHPRQFVLPEARADVQSHQECGDDD